MSSPARVVIFLWTVTSFASLGLHAQSQPYSADFLPVIRRAATLIPGEYPSAVRVVSLSPFRVPVASMVDSEPNDTVNAAFPVFQIRFPHGWIIADAAMDREFEPDSKTWSNETASQIQLALRDARLVVVTHEHHDHVAGVIRSPYLSRIQAHTLLNRQQVHSLIERPNSPLIKIDSSTAARYLIVDFDVLLPIAPGVVLIKAAGHTPGSQIVYVHLASGREVILAGDVAWHMLGIETQRQKPTAMTQEFGGEDREAIGRQLRWLKDISGPETFVVVAHDEDWIETLVRRGILFRGFDFKDP